METALTTKSSTQLRMSFGPFQALVWKAWQETRARFFAAFALLAGLVGYAVLISNSWLGRYDAHHPGEPLVYSAYIWGGLFNWLLQSGWILGAFVVALGGLRREGATGAALYTLGLPVKRFRLIMVRAGMVVAQSLILAVVPALLIPGLSWLVGRSYPVLQAVEFGLLMGCAGLIFPCFGVLLSTLFEGEFTAPVLGICVLGAVFVGFKQQGLRSWSITDVMSGTNFVDPATQMLGSSAPWLGLCVLILVAVGMVYCSAWILKVRDF
jgi:ABC-type transport system involved in multi-copper enzyme maturation permease subunit